MFTNVNMLIHTLRQRSTNAALLATDAFRVSADQCPLLLSRLNRSTQHFIVEEKIESVGR